jgi:membrane fusion protein, multidrug efflux system
MNKIQQVFIKLIKRKLFLIFLLLLCSAAFIFLKFGWIEDFSLFQKNESGGKKYGAGRPELVKVAQVQLLDLVEAIETVGTLKPEQLSVVRPRVEGLIQTLYFKEGEVVKVGQVLAQLDAAPFEYALQIAQSQLEREQVALASAKHELQRLKIMAEGQAVSAQQLDQQTALLHQLSASVQAQSAVRDQARLNLSFTKVRAPVTGQIGLRQVDVGNLVRPTDTNGLASIVQTDRFLIEFAFAQRFWSRIQNSMKTQKHERMAALQVDILDRSTRLIIAKASLVAKDNTVDSATGTVRFKAKLQENINNGLANQLFGVRLILQTHYQQISVPIQAVQFGRSGSFLWVVDDNHQVRRVEVQTGVQDAGYIAVQGRLQSGDHVVMVGTDRLREGLTVQIAQ